MNQTGYKGKGLLPLLTDKRDFSHSAVFGSIAVDDLPTRDFLVAVPLEIKDQDINYPSDYCTSYASSECGEDEDQVIFVPEYSFQRAKDILAVSQGVQVYSQFGLNLRDICNSAVQYGFLPRINDPFRCDTMDRPARDTLIASGAWPAELDSIAANYKKASYFAVDGPHDLFDNIRSVMWMNLAERRSVEVGCLWRESWSAAPQGIIPEIYEEQGSAHAFKFCGQKTINGNLYLVAQLSDGPTFGDDGFFYFSRAVVNREFGTYGSFTYSHMPPDSAEWHVTNGVSIYDSFTLKVLKLVSNLMKL